MYKKVYDQATFQAEQNQPGVVALRKVITEIFNVGDYGILSKRKIRGGYKLSVHAEGRAWDCKVNALNTKEKIEGDKIADFLWACRTELGIQKIIWDRQFVDVFNTEWQEYTGVHKHQNHLHVELTKESATERPLIPKYIRAIYNDYILAYN